MKKRLSIALFVVLLLFLYAHTHAGVASAACNWTMNADGTVTAVTCGIDGQSTEAYDYTSCPGDDSTNAAILTINTGTTITLNAGSVGNPTKLIVGRINSPGTGRIVATADYVTIISGSGNKCYVTDADGDGYSSAPSTCYDTSAAGRVRRRCLTATTVDCGDGNASAKPGQTTASSSTFTNTATGLSYDWNCDGVETKTYATAPYSCSGCTNGSGYASYQNTTSGFQTSVPNCGASGTYYTVTNNTCRDPAVANCSTSVSTSTVTQTCL